MRFTHAGEGRRRVATLAAIGVLSCAPPASGADVQAAAWMAQELTFVYHGHATYYSCDALQTKMREILIQLGARADLKVTRYGCTSLTGPDPLPGVRIEMNVLQPAGADSHAPVAAQWKEVDLVANRRDPREAEFECELFNQIGRKVLPLFAARNVQQVSSCEYRNIVPGSTQLKAEVLVPEPAVAASGAR